ncbi:MAG: hypothetical protein ACRBG0_09260 [Lewinella sp.]|uniref:hypothetical protein n=1 Tax=Lewinella sp. TaxID=2004506 RepID=UPI003D6BB873
MKELIRYSIVIILSLSVGASGIIIYTMHKKANDLKAQNQGLIAQKLSLEFSLDSLRNVEEKLVLENEYYQKNDSIHMARKSRQDAYIGVLEQSVETLTEEIDGLKDFVSKEPDRTKLAVSEAVENIGTTLVEKFTNFHVELSSDGKAFSNLEDNHITLDANQASIVSISGIQQQVDKSPVVFRIAFAILILVASAWFFSQQKKR